MFLAAVATLIPAAALADTGGLSAYMNGRAAAANGQVDVAAADYARALDSAPGNAVVAIRAYREALSAGDEALAIRAAAVLDRAGVAPGDAALIPLAQAARAGNTVAAAAAIAKLASGPLVVLVPSLSAWVAFAGRQDPAPLLAAAARDPLAARFAAETRALLTIAAGRTDDGIAALSARDDLRMPSDLRVAAAQLLFGQGKATAARALLAGTDPTFVALRDGFPAKPTLGFGVSRLLTRVASDLASGTPTPLSVALTRAALAADPSYDRSRILLADALLKAKATERALSVIDGVAAGSSFANAAAAERVVILTDAGRDADAIAVAKQRADADGSTAYDWQRYADLLVTADRPADAVPYYRRVIDRGPEGDGWAAWLQYGGALDQAGRWPQAREALETAVAKGPSQPMALNYLGFARIERGEDLPAAAKMLERARALDPQNASIADSLGWAYHLTGDTARGLPLIEGAAADEPTNAEIAEHLGDAYWTIGRRFEARYAWRAAALTATPPEMRRLTTKIAQGLAQGAVR